MTAQLDANWVSLSFHPGDIPAFPPPPVAPTSPGPAPVGNSTPPQLGGTARDTAPLPWAGAVPGVRAQGSHPGVPSAGASQAQETGEGDLRRALKRTLAEWQLDGVRPWQGAHPWSSVTVDIVSEQQLLDAEATARLGPCSSEPLSGVGLSHVPGQPGMTDVATATNHQAHVRSYPVAMHCCGARYHSDAVAFGSVCVICLSCHVPL